MDKRKEDAINFGYRKLAGAIVGRAIIDFYEAENTVKGRRIRHDVERFVASPWFQELTELNPDYVLDKLHSSDERFRSLVDPAYNIRKRVESGKGEVSFSELMILFNKSPKTIDRMINDGRLMLSRPPVRGHERMVTAVSVKAYLEAA